MKRNDEHDLPQGLYERVITERLAALIGERTGFQTRDLGGSEAPRVLGRHLGDYISRAIQTVPERDRPTAQVAIANALIAAISDVAPKFYDTGDEVRPQLPLSAMAGGAAVPQRRSRSAFILSRRNPIGSPSCVWF